MNSGFRPKIRFKIFTDDWEERKLSDLTDYSNGTGHEEYVVEQGKYELITLKSINSEGELVSSEKYIDEEFKTLKQGTLIMMLSEQAKGMLGMTTVIPCDNRYVLNQRVAALTLHDNVDASFLTKAINNKQAYFEQMGAGTKVQNISKNHVEGCLIRIPCYEEQQRIGGCFNNLDNLIALQHQKCNKLTDLKKSLLEKMFPHNNSLTPEIRFGGFTGNWEQCKLGDLGCFRSNGVDKKINENEIEVNLLNYTDVYNSRKINNKNAKLLMKVTAKRNQIMECNIAKNDIFFTPTSETPDDIGRVLVIEESLENTVYSYHLMRYRPKSEEFYSTFPNYGFTTKELKEQMRVIAKGVQRYVISKPDFEQLEIKRPMLEEQKKIALFMTCLDTLISLHQRKYEKLKKIKQSLMNDIFA